MVTSRRQPASIGLHGAHRLQEFGNRMTAQRRLDGRSVTKNPKVIDVSYVGHDDSGNAEHKEGDRAALRCLANLAWMAHVGTR
jgi:hypothetical protein